MKKNVMIAAVAVAVLVSLTALYFIHALRWNENHSADGWYSDRYNDPGIGFFLDQWEETRGASLVVLLKRLFLSYGLFGIGVAILCFSEAGGVVVMLVAGGVGLGLMVCTVCGFFARSILLGIPAAVISVAYLQAAMTFAVRQFREYVNEHKE